MRELHRFLRYVAMCWAGWRALRRRTTFYGTVCYRGVPYLTMVFAADRDAWRVADFAAGYFAERGLLTRGWERQSGPGK